MASLFFRVESKTKPHPYTDKFLLGFYSLETDTGEDIPNMLNYRLPSSRHPIPQDDSLLCRHWGNIDYNEREYYYFGANSIAQLRAWFYNPEVLAQFRDYLCIAIYEVDEVVKGYSQSVCHVNKVIRKVGQFEIDCCDDELYSFVEGWGEFKTLLKV